MAVSYNKLWKLLIDKGMNRTQMMHGAGITGNVLGKLSRNEYVSMLSMERIRTFLDCDIGDVMELTRNSEILEHYTEVEDHLSS